MQRVLAASLAQEERKEQQLWEVSGTGQSTIHAHTRRAFCSSLSSSALGHRWGFVQVTLDASDACAGRPEPPALCGPLPAMQGKGVLFTQQDGSAEAEGWLSQALTYIIEK